MGLINTLEENYDIELIEEFVEHIGFMCASLDILILGLEREEHYEANIQELFRVFHNIKSASLYFKLTTMAKLSELIEDVLEEARQDKGVATQDFIDWMLLVSDQFNKWKNNLELNMEELSPYNPKLIRIPKNIVEKPTN